MPIARILTATDRDGIVARLAEHFDAEAAAGLAAAADARILTFDAAAPEPAVEIVRRLRAAGAVAWAAGTLVATVATATQLGVARAESGPLCFPAFAALALALRHATESRPWLRLRESKLDLRQGAQVMGILNLTPDSFYERTKATQAVSRALELSAQGAAIVDIGGQSYAGGNPRISADEERARVLPAVRGIIGARSAIVLSIDTTRAAVADAALAAGAHLINDCSGLADPLMAATVARYDAGLIVMHIKGELNVRSASYRYGDALAEIVDFLYTKTELARAAGVSADAIAIDPGLEFGKEPATDLEILDRFGELTALGYPILLASSRKNFMSRLFALPAADLLIPSLATAGLGISAGARLLRVHDVAQTVQLARMYALVAANSRPAGNPNATAPV